MSLNPDDYAPFQVTAINGEPDSLPTSLDESDELTLREYAERLVIAVPSLEGQVLREDIPNRTLPRGLPK
jgi:hypothetical protein